MNSGDNARKLEAAKRSFASNTRRVGRYGRILLWALIIEVFLPIIFREHTSLIETVIGVACAFAVAIGVWGEIHFGEKAEEAAGELKDEADRQVAEAARKSSEADERAALANVRAAEADLKAAEAYRIAEEERLRRVELEQRRAPRRLTADQYDRAVEQLTPFGALGLDVGILICSTGTLEPLVLAHDLEAVFGDAGWEPFVVMRTDMTLRPGTWVQVASDASPEVKRAAREVVVALQAAEIAVSPRTLAPGGGTFVGDEEEKRRATGAPIQVNVGEHPARF